MSYYLFNLIFFFSLLTVPAYAADKNVPLEKPLEKKKPIATAGIFYGHIFFVQPELISIIVKPTDEKLTNQTFLLDRKSRVKFNKKTISKEKLNPGQKVAVRYFGLDRILIADEIFIVTGEFNPRDYVKRRRYKVTTKPQSSSH